MTTRSPGRITERRRDNRQTQIGTHATNKLIANVASTAFSSLDLRNDNNGVVNLANLQNYGVTAANHGVSLSFPLGKAGALVGNAAVLFVQATDTWAAPANESARMLIQLRQAGSVSSVATLTSTGGVQRWCYGAPGGTGLGTGRRACGSFSQGSGSGGPRRSP